MSKQIMACYVALRHQVITTSHAWSFCLRDACNRSSLPISLWRFTLVHCFLLRQSKHEHGGIGRCSGTFPSRKCANQVHKQNLIQSGITPLPSAFCTRHMGRCRLTPTQSQGPANYRVRPAAVDTFLQLHPWHRLTTYPP